MNAAAAPLDSLGGGTMTGQALHSKPFGASDPASATHEAPHRPSGAGLQHAAAQLETAGVHVTIRALSGPWAAQHAALCTRWPDDTWTVDLSTTAPPSNARHALATVAALRQHGAGNTGWTPGPNGTLWRYF